MEMANLSLRRSIEKNILDKLHKVDLNLPHLAWITSQEFKEFLKSWEGLVEYYKHHDDNDIGTNLMAAYLKQCQTLRTIMTSKHTDRNRENARLALNELEYYWMSNVLKQSSGDDISIYS